MFSDISNRTFVICIAVLLLVHLAIAATMAWHLNIWMDEASTMYATRDGFWVAFQTAAAEQKQAPLYFWIVSIWRSLDQSIFFARIFSILCSIASIIAFARLAKRFFTTNAVLLFSAFLAMHPFMFWASTEIRVYSLVVLLSVILIQQFFEAFYPTDGSRSTRWSKVWFLFATITALYTNYYLGFLVAGFFVGLAINRRWKAIGKFAIIILIAGFAFLPLALTVVAEIDSRNAGFHEPRSIIEGVKIVWGHLLTFILPTEIYTPDQLSLASSVRLWIVRAVLTVLVILAFIRRKNISEETLLLAGITATIMTFMIVANLLVGPSLIVIRHASMLFVPVILFSGLLIRDVGKDLEKRSKNFAFAFGAAVLAVFFAYGVINMYPEMTKRGDWDRASRFIQENGSADQPIAVFPVYEALIPRFYFIDQTSIVPKSGYFKFVPEAPDGSPERFLSEIEFLISEIPKDADSLWLSVNDRCESGQNCLPLQKYIEANYTIEVEKEFYLQKLYLLKKKSQ